ncbi:MAG TPA: DUF896 domain-containing protein [Syntrophomonadaceae bacterium]|nr:DUF896 domain-containing protein [Syntrophomonadaceae bacterium]
MEKRIQRINDLAKKKKGEGLSEEELQEQQELYAWYLEKVKNNVKCQLDAIRVGDTPSR